MTDGVVVAVAPLAPEHRPVDIQTDPGVGTSEHIVGLRLCMVESFLINNLDLQAHH